MIATAERASSACRARLGTASLLVLLGVAVAASAAAHDPSGAATPSPDKTIPTLPPGSGDVPATATVPDTPALGSTLPDSSITGSSVTGSSVTGSSVVVVPATTEPGIDTGIPLRAGAGPSELFAAGDRALNATDIASGLGSFAVIPAGIPTPAGSTIRAISVSYSADLESYAAGAELTTSADGDDVVVYYETMLTEQGYDTTRDHAEGEIHELEFVRAGPSDSAVRVLVDSTDDVAVDIEVTADADLAALHAFAGWPAGLPRIDGGRPTAASVTATRNGATIVTMSTTFAYEGTNAGALSAEIRDGVANGGGGYRIADSDQGGATIALEHPIIDDVVAEVSDADGVTLLRVDGSLP